MPVINEVINPATEATDLKAKGILKRIIIKRINEDGSPKETLIKTGIKKGSKIVATHRYAIVLESDGDEVLIGFGEGEVKNLKYENQFQVKDGEKYKDLVVGQEISIYPVATREYEKDGEKKTAYNAKRKDIKILTEAPAGASAPAASSGSSAPSAASGNLRKPYGEITSLEQNVATVHDDKQNADFLVNLSEDQAAEVVIGGRLTAYIDDQGNVVKGFKAYPPLTERAKATGKSGGKSTYDQTGVETGHAINGLAILLERGYQPESELETAKLIHAATLQVKQSESARTGKSLDAVGSSAGNAVLNACRRVPGGSANLQEDLVKEAQRLLVELAEPLYAFIAGETTPLQQNPAEGKPEPVVNTPQQPLPPAVEEYEPVMDFDDDVPFAYAGLQYATHAIHCLY